MAQIIKKIYLHWTATPYDWAQPGHYHTVILGNGTVKHLTGYDQALNYHTAGRNLESVALAVSCMGTAGWTSPPTAIQIENMCKETAQLAFKLGWQPEDINIYRVMTHAEAAANRDCPIEKAKQVSGLRFPTSTPQAEEYMEKARQLGLPHENYGPSSWFDGWPGGFVERWDLWQLKPSDREGEGGLILRNKIKNYLVKMAVPEVIVKPPTSDKKNECPIYLGSQLIATGYLLSDNRCYVQLSKLTAAYGFSITFNQKFRYVNLQANTLKAKYLANSPLILGYPVIDIYLNRPQDAQGETISDQDFPVQPFMQGIIIENSTYVLIADFCNELGIPYTFQTSDRSLRLKALPATK
ncbi:peptidoglycan recognition family protein [Microcoleus sp. FACHB-672]|uniref:peptidoglycan recognition protein family protein n=1 Tax=Microcoleus sp. FACHB-672 TaxID=2692825 RepID=UPI001684D992|nr:peptidoglycan recognition family protein [Microcoleus sp. FACHB-672]MBD2041852.1 N-acetylmuramoyl-L-alanine amidase [Microcoleus sp. FACHB-672]